MKNDLFTPASNAACPPILAFSGEHRFLSNFWSATVRMNGRDYPSVENAFQAAKSMNAAERARFERCSASEAKRMGRRVTLRPDWDAVKLAAMEHLLAQKFAAGSRLASMLEATGERTLVEGNTWGDTFWGVCKGKGANNLGILLMKIRANNRLAPTVE